MDVNELLDAVESKSKKTSKAPYTSNTEDKSFDNVMDSISQNWTNKTDKDFQKLQKELLATQNELKKLKSQKSSFTKNEEKILNAIKSEALLQKTNEPQISSRVFRTTYKVSSDYFRKSIDSLIVSEAIERIETKFAGKVPTYRWKVTDKSLES